MASRVPLAAAAAVARAAVAARVTCRVPSAARAAELRRVLLVAAARAAALRRVHLAAGVAVAATAHSPQARVAAVVAAVAASRSQHLRKAQVGSGIIILPDAAAPQRLVVAVGTAEAGVDAVAAVAGVADDGTGSHREAEAPCLTAWTWPWRAAAPPRAVAAAPLAEA